ncbi:unnamed protein product [Calypogeia fissa]
MKLETGCWYRSFRRAAACACLAVRQEFEVEGVLLGVPFLKIFHRPLELFLIQKRLQFAWGGVVENLVDGWIDSNFLASTSCCSVKDALHWERTITIVRRGGGSRPRPGFLNLSDRFLCGKGKKIRGDGTSGSTGAYLGIGGGDIRASHADHAPNSSRPKLSQFR